MKFGVIIYMLLLVACSTPQTQLPISTVTPNPSSTPKIIEVTRIIKIEQTVVVTATPEPLLAQDCVNTAQNQLELTGCAALEWQLAREELNKTISQIEFSQEDKQTFDDQLQKEWEKQVETNCEFYYHKWGSMGPMQRNFCIAEQYKQRNQDLRFAYLNP